MRRRTAILARFALLALLIVGGLFFAAAEVGKSWHPIAIAAQAMTHGDCAAEGWGDATCAKH